MALTKAIGKQEHRGRKDPYDFTVVGADGERGAYQMTPDFIKANAPKYLQGQQWSTDNLSAAQQDELAYKVVEARGKAGLSPAQVASEWNSGKADAYKDPKMVGTSKGGAQYDVPGYVNSVSKYYQEYLDSSGHSNASAPVSQQAPDLTTSAKAPEQGLGERLGQRVTDATQAITDAASGKQSMPLISAPLQVAGAVAGGIGDVVNAGLELIPGVKAVEGVIGDAAGAFFNTDAGKAVAKSMQDFSAAHPELSKNIGSVFNIVTAIPILKGLGVVKNLAMDASSLALKKAAESSAEKELTSVLGRTIGGKKVLAKEPGVVKTLVTERALPDFADGKYSTQEAYSKLDEMIGQIEDGELQPALKAASGTGVSQRVAMEDMRQNALKAVRDEFKSTGQVAKAEAEVNRVFDDYRSSYGDYATLEDLNDMKRGIRKSVNFNSPKLESDVTYHIGQTFQGGIEAGAKAMGLPDVHSINARMAALIRAQNALKHVEGKPVKSGLVGNIIKDTATVGGEMAGNATGIPLAGAFIGREAGGLVGKRLTQLKSSVLSRTGKGAVRTTAAQAKRGLVGGLAGAAMQKAAR